MTQQDESALAIKRELIWKIIETLRGEALLRNKQFDVALNFFRLAFMSDDDLNVIASLCGLKKAKASPPQEV